MTVVIEGTAKDVNTPKSHRGHLASHNRTLQMVAMNTDESASAIQEAGAQSLKTVIATEQLTIMETTNHLKKVKKDRL